MKDSMESSTAFYNFIVVRLKDSKPSIVGYDDNYDDATVTLIENRMQYHDDQFEIYELTKRKVNTRIKWVLNDE